MEPREIVTRYLDGLSRGDVDAVVALVSDDFHNEHTSTLGSDLHGRAAYAERLPQFLAGFTDLRYDVVTTIADNDEVAARYRLTAIVDGHPIDIPGVMLFQIVDGLIARRTDVWDSLTFLRQTGAAQER